MTEITNDQEHLDADVAGYTTVEADFVETVIHLKTQVATNPSAPASSLDFTKADALLAKMQVDDPIENPAATAGPTVDVPAPVVDEPVDTDPAAESDTPIGDDVAADQTPAGE